MRQPNRRRVRLPVVIISAASAWAVALPSGVARAESPPPESPYRVHEVQVHDRDAEVAPEWAAPPEAETSLFRVSVGPALLFEPASPGLLTALDIGRRAVGARLSAAFMRPENERGLAAYGGELWVDLGHRSQLHPLLGAGVSLLHGGALGRRGNSGAGVLRAGLEYELPIAEADARLGVNVIGLVPAIESDRTRPWVLGGVTIGAGF
jgi:hypothetical protein